MATNHSIYTISKTSFLKFEQCPKAFFLYKNHPYLRDKISVEKQATFNRGHAVGELAHELFPDGIDVSLKTKNVLDAVELTKELISKKSKTIYEAAFIYDKVLVMIDILNLTDDKYVAYEVKSSLKVSEIYLIDASLQYYVLKNSCNNLDDFFLVTLNGDYILEDQLETKKLFKKRSIKNEGEKNLEYFRQRLFDAELLLEQNIIPNTPIGKHCFKPYQCDFFGTCWKGTDSEKSIFNLPLAGKDKLFEWYNLGIRNYDEVNDELIENKSLLKIKNSFISNEAIINHKVITELIDKIKFPVAAIDMEIWSPAIPIIKGTKPFQQLPFLFCLYDGSSQTYFLTEHFTDERLQFALELIEQTKNYASILVYDKTMEEQMINSLIGLFPNLKLQLEELKDKMLDLFEIFKNLHYYHPAFKNNFSLKVITDVLNLGVHFTDIKSGLEAMNTYERMRLSEDMMEKQKLNDSLVEYCYNDTKGAFMLYEYLKTL